MNWVGFVFDALFSSPVSLLAQAPSNYPQLLRALNYIFQNFPDLLTSEPSIPLGETCFLLLLMGYSDSS